MPIAEGKLFMVVVLDVLVDACYLCYFAFRGSGNVRFHCPIILNDRCDDWSLVRQLRLSTVSVPDTVVAWLEEKKAL